MPCIMPTSKLRSGKPAACAWGWDAFLWSVCFCGFLSWACRWVCLSPSSWLCAWKCRLSFFNRQSTSAPMATSMMPTNSSSELASVSDNWKSIASTIKPMANKVNVWPKPQVAAIFTIFLGELFLVDRAAIAERWSASSACRMPIKKARSNISILSPTILF